MSDLSKSGPAERKLRIGSLSAGYPKRPVIRQLTLSPIDEGSITTIVGPNGAGKSTLLRAVAGLLPAEGHVSLGADDLLALRPAERAARVGFMPQTLPAGASLCVLESVIGAIKAGSPITSIADAENLAAAVIERLGILAVALEPLDRLSGGQRQMASLAQAIARSPKLLLLDEPTSALDLHRQLQVMTTIRDLARQGTIVLMVMHDLAFAARWSDRMVVLHQGALDSEGACGDVMTADMMRRVYRVVARVERCSRNTVQIMTDDLIDDDASPH